MASFFQTKDKYIISFSEEDLIEKEILSFFYEINLENCKEIKITLLDSKDIKIKNLIVLILLKKFLKKHNIQFILNINEDLLNLFKSSNKFDIVKYL